MNIKWEVELYIDIYKICIVNMFIIKIKIMDYNIQY